MTSDAVLDKFSKVSVKKSIQNRKTKSCDHSLKLKIIFRNTTEHFLFTVVLQKYLFLEKNLYWYFYFYTFSEFYY